MKRKIFVVGLSWVVFLAGMAAARPFPHRLVVLYAAASPILKELGVGHEVVGVTRHDHTFPGAVEVGSHLHPNLELIKALKPDLIIAGSHRAFPKSLQEKVKAPVFYYDPQTLDDILAKIEALGKILHREAAAQKLVARLQATLSQIKKPSCHPRVIYEVSERPLKVSGQKDIITNLIQTAGGENPVKVSKKHVLLTPEEVLLLKPDIYIYQVGPMNRNPTPPKERAYFADLKAKVVRVKELEFARPGLNAFGAALKLNRFFRDFCQASQARSEK